MGTLLQDLRYAVRMLRKSPGFATVAVVTLALAIGANAVVFSVMNALIIRPLDVPQGKSLYAIWRPNVGDAHQYYSDYLALRDRNRSFDGLAAYDVDAAGFDSDGNPTPVWVYAASGNYFDALRIQPFLGRLFHASDEHGPNSAPYIVLSYGFWHTHFRDDRSVIGRVVQLNKHPYTIIGVTPPQFHGTMLFFNPQLFVPIVQHSEIAVGDLNARDSRWVFMVLGHLTPGVTQAQAVADLNATAASLKKTYPKDDAKLTFSLARPGLYGDYLGRPVKEFMTALMLLAGLILLAACANLGSLFAARAADRSREVALRLALGSTRRRILRQLFTEALLISVIGGAIGVWGSIVLLHGLSVWQPIPRWPIHLAVNPDASVYAVALLLTLASGFLFGAVPVRQVLHTSLYELVKSGTTGRVGHRITLRDVLLVVQIAICAVLVTASMVAVRGMSRSLHNNFGFELQNTLIVDTDLTMAAYHGDQVPAVQKRMLQALEAIPGVQAVGLADYVPLGDSVDDSNVFSDSTSDLTASNAAADANMLRVSPEYFHASGTVLLSGRAFSWHDDKNAPRIGIVNQEFARRLFGSPDKAMGRHFKMPDGTRIEVVGIVENGKYSSLTEDPQPTMFLPILQWPSNRSYFVVHSERDPGQLASIIKARLHEVDRALPIDIQTRYRVLDAVLFGPRMATISLGIMGVMGAMLAITGIFGMAAYSVSKRLKELGIRIALGAQKREVLHAALARPMRLLAFGSAAGLLVGILASRLLAFVVYQATPRDPLVLAAVVLAMLLLGLLATWIPAQRALRIDPVKLLREE